MSRAADVGREMSTARYDANVRSVASVRRQIITVHLGQCGTQIGTKFWDLVAHEHSLDKNGHVIDGQDNENVIMDTLFDEAIEMIHGAKSTYFPRAVFMDLEPTVINDVMTSASKNFYEPARMVRTSNETGGNFARVRGAMGGELINIGCEAIRAVVEECDLPDGALMIRGAAGGAGGGIAPEICAFLRSYLNYVYVNEVVPSNLLPAAPTESYNYILATNLVMPQADLIIKYDNFKVMNMIQRICGPDYEPTWNCLNHQIVQSFANLTSERFKHPGCRACAGSELTANLQVFPSFKHITPAMGPISASMNVSHNHIWKPELLLGMSFANENNFLDVDSEGKIFAMTTTFRGNFDFNEVYGAVQRILGRASKFSPRFVAWTQPIKLSLITTPISMPKEFFPPWEPQMLFRMTNESGIKTHYLEWLDKYCQLLNRGAFQASYTKEGMDLAEFQDAFENIKTVCSDYGRAVDGFLFEEDAEDGSTE